VVSANNKRGSCIALLRIQTQSHEHGQKDVAAAVDRRIEGCIPLEGIDVLPEMMMHVSKPRRVTG
jgi:hypothetical protein